MSVLAKRRSNGAGDVNPQSHGVGYAQINRGHRVEECRLVGGVGVPKQELGAIRNTLRDRGRSPFENTQDRKVSRPLVWVVAVAPPPVERLLS